MPTIELRLNDGSQDGRALAYRSGSTQTFPTNVDLYEQDSSTPFLTFGFPVGGKDESASLTENKGFIRFSEVTIPKGSVIESAVLTVFARVEAPAGGAGGTLPQQINISAHTDTTLAEGQATRSYTSFITSPVRDEKGTFTLQATETTHVEKTADITSLVQSLVTQFDYSRDEMIFRLTNKTFTQTVAQYPFPRPTTVPPSFTASSTQIQANIYDFELGGQKSPRLEITYRTGAPCTGTFCEDFDYSTGASQQEPSHVSRGMDDPNNFPNQATADAHYPTSDIAVIRINAPFPDTSNRLDINCPPSAVNAGGTGDNTGGVISGGLVSDESWNYRFKIDITAFTVNTDPTGQSIHIGLGDSDETVFSNIAQDFIGFKISTAGSVSSFQLIGADGIGPDTGGAIEGTFTTPVATGVYFVEVAREGNDGSGFSHISCALFNDKDFTDLIERVSGITPSGITGLNKLKFMSKNIDGTGNGNITVEYGQRTSQPVDVTGRVTIFDSEAVAKAPAVDPWVLEDRFNIIAGFDDRFLGDNWSDIGAGFGVDTVQTVNDWTADNSVTHNLTQFQGLVANVLSDNSWVLRFKLDIENIANGTSAVNNGVFFGIMSNGATGTTWSTASSYDSLGMVMFINNSTASFNLTSSRQSLAESIDTGTFVPFATVPTAGVIYVELKKTSTTSFTVNLFSDAGFTQLIESETGVIVTTQGMRVFKMLSRNNGTGSDSTLNGNIDNFQFSNSTSDFFPTGWNQTGTRVFVDQALGFTDVDSTKDGSLHQISRDVGTVNNKWTLRFDCEILSSDVPVTNDAVILVNISDSDDTVGVLSAQDTITFEYNSQGNTGVKRLLLRASDGVGILSGSTVDNFFLTSGAHDTGDGRFFVEIKRTSATEALINIYSDPDFTNLIHASGATTIPASITGLRFIRISTRDDVTSAGTLTSRIDRVQFWNGKDVLEQNNNWKVNN